MNIRDRIKAIDNEYSESEIYLEYGLPSLYRVFEYAAANHYKPLFNPTQYKPEDAIEYYLNLALTYNPNPLYYIDFGSKKAKPKLYNFFTVLKLEAKKILDEWSTAPFLSNKRTGEIIYLTGRNFTAHGASGVRGERNMQYDYDKNYLHINNVNILLEIIARYVIELLNPELKNVVERRTVFYKERYKQLLEKNKEKTTHHRMYSSGEEPFYSYRH